jgi:hypothetical protein
LWPPPYVRVDLLPQIGAVAHCSSASDIDLTYQTKEVRKYSIDLSSGLGPGSAKFDVAVSTGTVERFFLKSPVRVTDLVSPYLLMVIKKCTTLPERIIVLNHEAYLFKTEFLDLPLSLNYNLEEFPGE